MTTPLPLPSKYFKAYLAKGYIKTGLEIMRQNPLDNKISKAVQEKLIDPVKDRFYFTPLAGAYHAFEEVIEYNG